MRVIELIPGVVEIKGKMLFGELIKNNEMIEEVFFVFFEEKVIFEEFLEGWIVEFGSFRLKGGFEGTEELI